MTHTTGRQARAAAVVAVMIGLVMAGGVAVAVVLDLHAPPEFNRGINALYEDGSFIVSVGEFSTSGCLPWKLCNGIGIDTPWEDIAPQPISDLLYTLVDVLFKR